MAENRYRRYLNGEESPRSSFLSGVTKSVVGAAAIIGGSAGAYYGLRHLSEAGHLAPIISKIGNKASYLDGYLTGLNKTFDSAGVFKTLMGDAQDELKANLTESFRPHVIGQMRQQMGKGALAGAPTRAENLYKGLGTARKQIAESVIGNLRMNQVLGDIKDLEWAKNNPELYKSVESMLKTDKFAMRAGFQKDVIRNATREQLNKERPQVIERALRAAVERTDIMSKHKDAPNVLSGSLIPELRDILAKYGSAQDFSNANKDVIKAQIQRITATHNKSVLGFGNSKTAGTHIVEKMFPEFKQLTMGEAVKRGIFDLSSLGVEVPTPGAKDIKRYMNNPHNLTSLPGFENMAVDPLVFVNQGGQVLDLRFGRTALSKTMDGLSKGFQIPLINLKPFRLMSVFNRESMERLPFHMFRHEDFNSIGGFVGRDLPNDDYFFAGGNVIDREGAVVSDRMKLASSKFGLFQREGAALAGHSKIVRGEPEGVMDHLRNLYDLGYQEYPSSMSRKFSGISKFWNLDWGRNLWYNVTNKALDASANKDVLSKAYGNFINTVDNSTSGLSRDTIEALKDRIIPAVGEDVYSAMVEGTQQQGTMRAIYKMLQGGKLREETRRDFMDIMRRHVNDPDAFDRVIRTVKKGYQADLPEIFQSFSVNTTELISSIDQAEKLLHMELLHQSQDLSKGVTVGTMVKELSQQGKLTEKQANGVLDLYVLNDLRNLGKRGSLTDHEAFAGLMQQPLGESQQTIHNHLGEMIKQANPMLGQGPGKPAEAMFGNNEFIPVRQTQLFTRGRDLVQNINEIMTQGGGVKDLFKAFGSFGKGTVSELGFGPKSWRAGKDNLDKVTTLTYGMYHYGYRLNEAISKVGLGLSTQSMGSPQELWGNMLVKRMLLPGLALGALGYANFELGNLTGEKPNQTLARTYAQMTMDVQAVKDIFGLNKISQGINKFLPGFNLLYENPLGMALKYGSFGIFGEDRGYDEMKYYYEKGYDPQRKGRFWSFGSNTPFYGGRIDYFAPSWYRQTMGQPEMTDSLYGSEREYWSNSLIPNPRNLFGLKPLLDPYHWENKHKEDRPYPVTSGTAIRQIPLVGPLADMPISAIFKPTRKYPGLQRAHEDYLSEINERYKTFINEANSGAQLMVYPGGRITPVSLTGEGMIYGEGGSGGGGYSGVEPGIAGGMGGASVAGPDGGIVVVNPTTGFGPMQSGSYISRGELSRINQNWVQASNVKPIDGRSIQLLRDHAFVSNLSEAVDPNSAGYRLGETAYSATEIGGIYGFFANTFFGLEGAGSPRVQLQSSQRMYGLERWFWDQNLGGLGGDISEIYRRFLPHRRRQIKEYNPIRNKMPDWMPGLDYFIDFKHGDPYVKIPKGEGRLPGAGYESMNKLHPDFFGEYGALDRFKILADVAPWSPQFKYYDSVVSKMNQAEMITPGDYEDAQRIREMVTQRKEKYDLYPYRFKYAGNIDKQTVTVNKMLDATTFMTDELPGQPIRLAGIKLPAKDSKEYQEIVADLQKTLSPGKKIRIGLESDSLNRVRDDVMGTMAAVMYDKWGDPVQAKMARKYGSIRANWDDNTATGVNALFESNQITLGKVWESFAHLDTPLHTKFLQVRSPLEHYKRQMLYGKDWQSWTHPFRDWVGPTIDSLSAGNPLISTGVGAGLGALFGSFAKHKAIGAIIGGLIGGIPSSIRSLWEAGGRLTGNSDYTWIPERRKQEREIEEYFDVLKYVKYKGLYEKARQVAIEQEGIDPTAIAEFSEGKGNEHGTEKRRLENIKRWLKLAGNAEDTSYNLGLVNDRLNVLSGSKMLINAGPMTMRALQYRTEYQATLYGGDSFGDLQVLYRSLPKKDRPFFTAFMTAAPEEREEILRLVPENQKRLYQSKWGLKADKQKTLEEYFLTHYLPDASWAGWKPEKSLEEVKLKFVDHQTALDIGEFGFWEDDRYLAEGAPKLETIRQNPLSAIDLVRLKKVLSGKGISDADIQITTEIVDNSDNLFNIDVDVLHDRAQDIKDAINQEMAYLFTE